MHYLFLDESYRELTGQRVILVASWAVEQARLNRNVDRLGDLFKPPILERINFMLEDLDAFALVAKASLAKSLFRSGEIDGTDDVPGMARADNIWSICTAFVVGSLLREFIRNHQSVGTLDVYFDPKSLRGEHATAWEKLLRQTLVSEARRFDAQLGAKCLTDLRIRRIQPVVKANRSRIADQFQMGTWVADKLCSGFGGTIAPQPTPRIKTWDMSEVIRRTVQQMDGKSYYDN